MHISHRILADIKIDKFTETRYQRVPNTGPHGLESVSGKWNAFSRKAVPAAVYRIGTS